MRQKIPRLIEVLANVAIIVVAVCVIFVLAKRYFLPTKPPTSPPGASALRKGMKVPMDGVDWAQNGLTLVLALQKDCHFCTESANFYQRLVEHTRGRSGVKLVAVLPQTSDEASQYLKGLKIEIADIRQSSLATIGVRGTPTLILVDKDGTVKESWVGRLPPEREVEVLNSIPQ
jgi:hypothetical protein